MLLAPLLTHLVSVSLLTPPLLRVTLTDVDAGVDAGTPIDAGPADAGSTPVDAGANVPDSGPYNFDAGSSLGNDPGDQDQDYNTIPSRCNNEDDCPLYFNCVNHKCQPQSSNTNKGGGFGCTAIDGSLALGLWTLSGLLWASRRRRQRMQG
jgi:hypothetical protein